jgi:hypothetical protein
MPLDPVLAKDTRAWFREAATPPILKDLVLHCRQAAAKAIKGFLTAHRQPFGKTHDLRELGKACMRIDTALEPLMESAMPLTWYA